MRSLLMPVIGVSLSACSAGQGAPVTIRTVSSYSGRPMAGIQVQVGDKAWRTTDADGRATFDGVQEPFEVRVHQTTTEYDYVLPRSYRVAGHGSRVQVRTGLTGREVVIDVQGVQPWIYDATMPGWHGARVLGSVVGRSGPPSATVAVQIAYYRGQMGTYGALGDTFDGYGTWEGGSSGTLLFTALEEELGPTPDQDRFHGFASAAVPVTDGAIVQGVSIALQPVAQSLVRGTVSLPEVYSADGASLRRWLAFPSKELLFLPEQVNRVVIPADRFVVALPWVAGTATWFGVSGHAPKFTGYGWHHRRIDFPPRDQPFSVPPPPDLLNPPESAPVASMTPFRWKTTETGGSSTLFVDCDWSSADPATPDPRHVSYAIETSGTELTLPAIPDLELRPGASCMWSVLWCATANPAEEERCALSATRTGATP